MTAPLRSYRPKAGSVQQEGFSLIEIVVAVAVVLTILGGALSILIHAESSFATQMEQVTLEQTGRRVLDRLSFELRQAIPASIRPLVLGQSKFISFQKVAAMKDGNIVRGPVISFGFELADGEASNHTDDNGDGRSDEGYLVYSEGVEPTVRLAGNLLDLSFNATATGVSFSLELAVVDRDGTLSHANFTQEVTFRNGP